VSEEIELDNKPLLISTGSVRGKWIGWQNPVNGEILDGKLPPFGQCVDAIDFEIFSVEKMTFLVEVVVD
jgi:hypothetical protein